MLWWNMGWVTGRKLAPLALLGGALGGCSGADEEDHFTYDSADMQALVVGAWGGDWQPADETGSTFTLDLTSVNDPEARDLACSYRTFSASTPGLRPTCMAGSGLRLSGTLTVADGSLPSTELGGEFSVWSLNLDGGGMLYLATSDQSVQLSADGGQNGIWTNCQARIDGTAVACSLSSRE